MQASSTGPTASPAALTIPELPLATTGTHYTAPVRQKWHKVHGQLPFFFFFLLEIGTLVSHCLSLTHDAES